MFTRRLQEDMTAARRGAASCLAVLCVGVGVDISGSASHAPSSRKQLLCPCVQRPVSSEPWLAGCKAYREPPRAASSANNSTEPLRPRLHAPHPRLPPAPTPHLLPANSGGGVPATVTMASRMPSITGPSYARMLRRSSQAIHSKCASGEDNCRRARRRAEGECGHPCQLPRREPRLQRQVCTAFLVICSGA